MHLAWAIQPARNAAAVRAINVGGSRRVFESVSAARVPTLIHASSVGAYGPGPKDRRVGESWPATGISTSFYSRHKAEVERMLSRFEAEHPAVRCVRLRPALIFKREAASEIRRLFVGPLLPGSLLRRPLIPVVPAVAGMIVQAVHADDVADAYRRALMSDVRGAFNIAAEPPLEVAHLAELLGARPIATSGRLLRGAADLTFRMRLQPSEPGWLDMGLRTPLMGVDRAHDELDWRPAHSALDSLAELLDGLRTGDGLDTPPLEPGGAGLGRIREFASGIGARRG